jgi:general secretion pathway protein H
MTLPGAVALLAPWFRRGAALCTAPSASRGVTLLELVIVMMLMAIIAAIALPMFGNGVSTSQLRSTAREVAASLRMARSEALATRKEARLVLNLEQRTFQLEHETRPHAMPKDVELKLFTAQSDIVDEKMGAIRFYPDGGSNGGRITIASGERKYEVDVDWLTGRVAILD